MKILLSLVTAASLCFAIGCGKSATCENAAEHIIDLMKKEMDGKMGEMLKALPAEARAEAEKKMAEELKPDKIAAQCKEKNFSKAALECVMKASTMEEATKCEKK